jgi:hypothetical protein
VILHLSFIAGRNSVLQNLSLSTPKNQISFCGGSGGWVLVVGGRVVAKVGNA